MRFHGALSAERQLCLRQVEADGQKVGTKSTDVRRVAWPAERLEPRLWIIIRHDLGAGATPFPAHADAYLRVALDVAHMACVTALLGDDSSHVCFPRCATPRRSVA